MENGVPDRGDVVWLDFSPQAGREQAGRRPALVLSPAMYNRFGLTHCCPITSQVKGYPFEVPLTDCPISGAVLSDHIRCVDWRARNADYICTAPEGVVEEVRAKLKPILGY